MEKVLCHVCSSPELYEHEGYGRLKRVTSDCKPWEAGGRLYSCGVCGCTQALCDDAWRDSIQSIYRDYTIYYQGGGEEQRVFDTVTGRARSEWLLECIGRALRMPENGRALDFGCGNGQFLKAFGSVYPEWKLSGVEFDEKYRTVVEALPGVEKFYTKTNFASVFDFISFVHVLEHIESPITFLKEMRAKLSPNGLLFVELPSYENNPFELLIIDHATHYSLESAQWTLSQAGFSPFVASRKWVSKELSILVNMENKPRLSYSCSSPSSVDAAISWLQQVAEKARKMRKESDAFGIFGTSIAGTWLAAELGDAPDFFVDEDQNRIGHTHLGAPIYAPCDVPSESVVFVAQPPSISSQIVARLEQDHAVCHYATA